MQHLKRETPEFPRAFLSLGAKAIAVTLEDFFDKLFAAEGHPVIEVADPAPQRLGGGQGLEPYSLHASVPSFPANTRFLRNPSYRKVLVSAFAA